MRKALHVARPVKHLLGMFLMTFLLASTAGTAGTAGKFSFTPLDSSAAFEVRLLWLQKVSGRFRDLQGSVRIDPLDGMAHVHALIRVDSVAVHPAHYRKRLLGNHFIDARRYPTIRFESAPLSVHDLRTGNRLQGFLSLHGVTRPLTLQLSNTRCESDGLDGCTLHLHGELDRTHFGMRSYRALVSSHVHLDLVIRLQSTGAEGPASSRSAASR